MAINCPYYFLICVKNALKLAYVHLSVQQTFRGVIPPNPRFKGKGREGKRLSFKSRALTAKSLCLLLLEVFSAAGRKQSKRLLKFVQNALKLAYAHLSVQNFSGG
jgi:ribosomal protein L16/L10AE